MLVIDICTRCQILLMIDLLQCCYRYFHKLDETIASDVDSKLNNEEVLEVDGSSLYRAVPQYIRDGEESTVWKRIHYSCCNDA